MRQRRRRDSVVGQWAEDKLSLLQKYLQAYNIALKDQPFKRIYIDGFAGAPISRVREKTSGADAAGALFEDEDTAKAQARFIRGSPLRALECNPGFDLLRFFDLDKSRVKRLRELAKSHGNKVKVLVGNCNPEIRKLADKFNARNLRGVAFLDPYGAHLEWETVQALARTKKIEAIINLPIAMAINRLIPKDGNVPKNWSAQLDACFGTREWYNLAYSESDSDLFGRIETIKGYGVAEKLLELYWKRLKDEFEFVAYPRLIQNTRGMPLYYLLWAGPNALGKKIANDVFRPYKKMLERRGRTLKV